HEAAADHADAEGVHERFPVELCRTRAGPTQAPSASAGMVPSLALRAYSSVSRVEYIELPCRGGTGELAMSRIVIVGGGISGLALAYRLEQLAPAAEVLVLERRDRLGGTVGTIDREGFRVERGPNGFLDNNPSTQTLCRDLGLGDRLIPASESARRNRFLFLRGQLRKLPTGLLSFLTSGVLSWRGKLALLTERLRRPRPDFADESIDA